VTVAKGIISNMFKPPFDSSMAKITEIEIDASRKPKVGPGSYDVEILTR
jgi:hypothetical protein